jgi:two-component system sensor histidine kinase ArlS
MYRMNYKRPSASFKTEWKNIMIEGNVTDEVMIKLTDSQRTLNRMSRIIKALLLISKIENDQYLKQEHIQMNALLDEVLEEIEERLNEREIKLYKHFYEDLYLSDHAIRHSSLPCS